MITSSFPVLDPNRQVKISFPDIADPVCQTLKAGRLWATELADVSSKFWTEDSVIMDVGAFIGTYAVLAACFTKNQVIAIEASPENFEYLEMNKAWNNLDNLSVFNVAAASKPGELQFTAGGSGGHVLEDQNQAGVVVKAVRLDDLLTDLGQLDFVKMDIEGYEIEALEGMKDLIQMYEPVFLFECNGHTLKFFDKTPNDLFAAFESFGYKLFLLNGTKLIPIPSADPFPFGVCDLFALKEKHLNKVEDMIGEPLTKMQRKMAFVQTMCYGNEDIQRYVQYYLTKVSFD